MKYLGIDYGEKRIGIAVSDDGGNLAFPKTILENKEGVIADIKKICNENKIEAIIIGESKNLKGENNPIQEKILLFQNKLAKEINCLIYLEPEFMTSMEARHLQEGLKRVDASAAALILKSFLDKKNNFL